MTRVIGAVLTRTVFLPVDCKPTDQVTLGFVPVVDAFKDWMVNGRRVNAAQRVNIGDRLPGDVTVHGELRGDWNCDPAGTIYPYCADVAVARGLTKALRFDAGISFGVSQTF